MKKIRYFTFSAGLLLLLACPVMIHADEIEEPEVIEEVPETTEEEIIPEETEILVEEEVSVEDNGVTNDELFEKYVDEQFGIEQDVPEVSLRKAAKYTGITLEGVNSVLYDLLSEKIADVAAGEIETAVFDFTPVDLQIAGVYYTEEELGVEDFMVDGKLTPETKTAFFDRIGFDLATVNKTLLYNHPYELYWYDKSVTGAMKHNTGFSISTQGLGLSRMKISMMVSADYSATGQTMTNDIDTELASSVQTAVENANNIVAEYESYNDYNKLVAYRDRVCALTDYNDDAADPNNNFDYGNPWQLIWVFDNDPSTTVVCEGYSKAFNYLCSKSTFDNPNLDCYLVSGSMDDEKHMWNIVTFGNKNYLVDVTNCDKNTVGYPDKLFLAGTSVGSAAAGYTVKAGSRSLVYTYDDSTKLVYTNAQLTLSQTAYIPPVKDTKHSLSLEGNIGVNFYLNLSDEVLADQDAYVEFTVDGQSVNSYLRDAHTSRISGKLYYVFSSEVTSVQMTSDIIAMVYLSTGSTYYKDVYNVKQYCDQAIETYADTNPELVQLMKSLLNYGGYAQVAFNTNTDRLANADLDDIDVSDVTAETLAPYEFSETGSADGLRYQNSSLTLNSLTTINHIFVVNNGHTINEFEFRLGDEILTPVKRGNKYYVIIPNIYSYDLDTPFTITVGGYTISYSGLSYGYKALTSTAASAELKNLVRAMYKYNQAANVYFSN